jgi:methyltransferase (TIGR00027 family)
MLLDGEPKILNDAPAVRLMGPLAVEALNARAADLQSDGARGLRAHVLLRSRFAEDRLAEAVARGDAQQFILLGAGGDTFAYRQPAWAGALRIIEVDHPSSQADKRGRLAVAGIEIPPNVTYAPIDFETTSLRDGLIANHVDLTVPTFFSWLGVTMYLTEAAIDAVLHTVIGFPSSSEIVFTFAQRRRPNDGRDGPTLAERAAAMGEPWLSYFEPDALEAKLRAFGFSNVYFLNAVDARERYFAGRADGLEPPRRTSIVSATV